MNRFDSFSCTKLQVIIPSSEWERESLARCDRESHEMRNANKKGLAEQTGDKMDLAKEDARKCRKVNY
jgi:hypothetical protein